MAKKDSYLKSAQKFLVKGQLDRAIKEYYKAIECDPRDYRVRHKLGELLARQGNRGEAINELGTVAEAYAKEGFLLKAIAVYKQMIKLKPDLYDVHLKLGDLYHQLSLMSEASEHYALVAEYYEVEGTARECVEVFRRIVELDPEDIHSKLKLAEYHVREGENDAAIKLYYDAASALKEKQRTDELIRVYERLIQLDPSRLETYKALAELYLQVGDPRRALAKLQICFKADSSDETTLRLLGESFLAMNQIPKAKSVFKELARIYAYQGFPEKQREVFERIHRMDPSDPDALELLFGDSGSTASGGTDEGTGATSPAQAPIVARPVEASRATAPPVVAASAQGPGAAPADKEPTPAPVPGPDPAATEKNTPALREIPKSVAKRMAEVDVYLEYGLLEKASSHLASIIEQAPSCYVAREKYRDLLIKRGRKEEAAAESAEMSMLASTAGDTVRAKLDLETAVQLDPGNLEYQHALASLSRIVGPPAGSSGPGDSPMPAFRPTSAVDIEIEEEDDSCVSLSQSLVSPAFQEESELVDDGGEEAQSIYLTLTGTDVQFVGLEGGSEEEAGQAGGSAEVGAGGEPVVTPSLSEEEVAPQEEVGAEGFLLEFQESAELVEDDESELDLVSEIEHELGEEVAPDLEAMKDTSRALEVARAYYDLGLYDEALKELEQLAGDAEEEVGVSWLRARCLFQKGRTPEAIRLFQATLNRTDLTETQELSIMYDLGLAYEAQGEYVLAFELFDEIYSINQHFRHKEVGAKLAELSARVSGGNKGSVGSAR